MNRDTRTPVRSLEVRGRLVDGRVVVGKGQNGFELSDVGGMIWRLADGSRTVDAIAVRIADTFDGATAAQVRADVREFVDALADDGYLEWAAPASVATSEGR
jgi:hypothetical protein